MNANEWILKHMTMELKCLCNQRGMALKFNYQI